jgi:hypothetical protein
MRTQIYGRILFGATAVLFGVIALLWYDADTWQSMISLWKLPFGTVIGGCFMAAQIAGGFGVIFPGTARVGSIILGIVYAVFSLSCVPSMIEHPTVYGAYGSFFEQFAMLCGALAVYAATDADAARSATLGRASRLGLGLCAISFTLAQIFYLKFTASLVPTWIPPGQMFWAVLTTIAFGLAAVSILSNVKARLALRLMTVMLALFGLLIWVPAVVTQPGAHGNWSEFAINFLITGAAWIVAELKSS